MANDRKTIAENLTRLVKESHWSRRQLADSVGLSDKTLWRWMRDGVVRTNGSNGEKLEALCQKLGVPVSALSKPQMSRADICAEKVREMVQIWEGVGIGSDWIDVWHIAATVVQRFKEEEPELWRRGKRLLQISTDVELRLKLEEMVREWVEEHGMDAETAFLTLARAAAQPQATKQ